MHDPSRDRFLYVAVAIVGCVALRLRLRRTGVDDRGPHSYGVLKMATLLEFAKTKGSQVWRSSCTWKGGGDF